MPVVLTQSIQDSLQALTHDLAPHQKKSLKRDIDQRCARIYPSMNEAVASIRSLQIHLKEHNPDNQRIDDMVRSIITRLQQPQKEPPTSKKRERSIPISELREDLRAAELALVSLQTLSIPAEAKSTIEQDYRKEIARLQEAIETALRSQNHHPKYDRQMILNLGSGNTARGITGKAEQVGLPCQTIDLEKSKEMLASDILSRELSQLTHNSRLYIIGHCKQGQQYINSDFDQQLSIDEIVQMFERYAPHLKRPSPRSRLTISVVACHSALDGQEESFTKTLSKRLHAAGFSVEVLGRIPTMKRAAPGAQQNFRKLTNGFIHHAPNSKVSFYTDEFGTLQRFINYSAPKETTAQPQKRQRIDEPINQHLKYDQQIILDLGSGKSAEGLKRKAQKKGLPCQVLPLHDDIPLFFSDVYKPLFSSLTPASRVYVIGKCNAGYDYIANGPHKLYVQALANLFAAHCTHLKDLPHPQRLKISLMAGRSAAPDGANESFAKQLSQELGIRGINAEVIGRLSGIKHTPETGIEDFHKYSADGTHHKPNEKVSFVTNQKHTEAQGNCMKILFTI